MGLSLPHLLVVVLLVFLLFGANRFPNMMGDLAKGIKSFKHGLKDEDEDKEAQKSIPAKKIDADIIEQDDRVNRS